MPIYEYLCSQCQLRFELMRPMSRASEDAPCPQGHPDARRVPSAVAAFGRSEDGSPVSLGGENGCASCSATSCSTCGV
ncbi:MAG: zinc ribbon domain-containing protein [Chloroflexi bacterium]|nr:zinc ribbon domain-containing protein [Chloroflexota bacterium]